MSTTGTSSAHRLNSGTKKPPAPSPISTGLFNPDDVAAMHKELGWTLKEETKTLIAMARDDDIAPTQRRAAMTALRKQFTEAVEVSRGGFEPTPLDAPETVENSATLQDLQNSNLRLAVFHPAPESEKEEEKESEKPDDPATRTKRGSPFSAPKRHNRTTTKPSHTKGGNTTRRRNDGNVPAVGKKPKPRPARHSSRASTQPGLRPSFSNLQPTEGTGETSPPPSQPEGGSRQDGSEKPDLPVSPGGKRGTTRLTLGGTGREIPTVGPDGVIEPIDEPTNRNGEPSNAQEHEKNEKEAVVNIDGDAYEEEGCYADVNPGQTPPTYGTSSYGICNPAS